MRQELFRHSMAIANHVDKTAIKDIQTGFSELPHPKES